MSNPGEQVRVTYTRGSGPATTIKCDLLVVACDPSPLIFELPGAPELPVVMPPTQEESEIFGVQKNFVFQTTLVSVPKPPGGSAYGVILDPATVRAMRGDVCGFRNESAKQYSLCGANELSENYLVVYQYWGPDSGTPQPTQQDLLKRLHRQLRDPQQLPWWPYGRNYTVHDILHTDYFHHFDKNGLQAKLPWKLLGIQGANRTVYVSASTCFESVLQCWQYQDLLLNPKEPRPSWLPDANDASIVIVGAGVSGLLFANRLRDRGYTGVTLLERDREHIGGKTHTVEVPTSGRNENTVCELGTCYMSPAYNDLVYQYLSPFTTGNTAKGFEVSPGVAGNFRGMVTTGTIYDPNHKPWPEVVAYDEYIVLSYQMWNGEKLDLSKRDEVLDAIAALLVEYGVVAEEAIGGQLPMPTRPPKDLEKLTNTYQNWLSDPNRLLPLKGLIGMLEYAYSVQGYGPLTDIPAYYGLVWISPSLAVLLVVESYFGDPLVTYWTKGWGDVWMQMAATLSKTMKIERGVRITSIDRNITAEA
jgi:NAD(P)-binding Rossmann-like domain